jgi:hypothetical protein
MKRKESCGEGIREERKGSLGLIHTRAERKENTKGKGRWGGLQMQGGRRKKRIIHANRVK